MDRLHTLILFFFLPNILLGILPLNFSLNFESSNVTSCFQSETFVIFLGKPYEMELQEVLIVLFHLFEFCTDAAMDCSPTFLFFQFQIFAPPPPITNVLVHISETRTNQLS